MYHDNPILLFTKFFILLMCSSTILFLYINNKQEHPNCLWNGATLYSLFGNGTIGKQSKCKSGSCDKQICDYISTPGISTVSIELLHPFPPTPPILVTKDYIWIVVFGVLFCVIVVDCAIVCYAFYSKRNEDYDTIIDSEEHFVAG